MGVVESYDGGAERYTVKLSDGSKLALRQACLLQMLQVSLLGLEGLAVRAAAGRGAARAAGGAVVARAVEDQGDVPLGRVRVRVRGRGRGKGRFSVTVRVRLRVRVRVKVSLALALALALTLTPALPLPLTCTRTSRRSA